MYLNQYPSINELAYAYGGPGDAKAALKSSPEDFLVDEVLGFELSGEGEHLWLFIEAIDMNTDFTLKQLARAFAVEKKNISYSGKKDRRAITKQWFSIHLPGKTDRELPSTVHENVRVLKSVKHSKKLRRGAHKENRFIITLRDLENIDPDVFSQKAAMIAERGYPNYFGPQRFGFQENNVDYALGVMDSRKRLKRQERDRVFSTLRSLDFNAFLDKRIQQHNWQRYLPGDALQLAGSSSFFQPEAWDEVLENRLRTGDIAIAGLLPGKGKLGAPLVEGDFESNPQLLDYLQQQRVEQGVRSLSVMPTELTCDVQSDVITLRFNLPKGAYATSLLRELLVVREN